MIPPVPAPVPEWQPPVNMVPAKPPTSDLLPHLNPSRPSIPSKRAAEDTPSADICPDIGDWLVQLNSDPIRRRIKTLDYAQYEGVLIKNGFLELSDLAAVKADKLLELVGEETMNFGIASRLVTYAQEDLEVYLAQVSKRTRVD